MSTSEPTRGEMMPRPASYALALLHDVQVGKPLAEYLAGIDESLAPYGGSFLIHGGSPEVVEGSMTSDVIVIAFPDADGAQHWYHSPASSWLFYVALSPRGPWCCTAARTPITVLWTSSPAP